MRINSRNKGSSFERDIARELHLLLGVSFKRDLDQYREKDRGDLIADSDAFPFVIECKRYANGSGCKPTWWAQANKAALEAQKFPAVIFKYDRKPVRVAVSARHAVECITRRKWSAENHLIEIDIEGFAYLCREGMS